MFEMPEAPDVPVAHERARLEALLRAQVRLAPRVRGVHVAVEHQAPAAAGALEAPDDVGAAVLDLLPADREAHLLERVAHALRHLELGRRSGSRCRRTSARCATRRASSTRGLLVRCGGAHRARWGRTSVANSSIWRSRSSPHSSSMTWRAAGLAVGLDRGDAVRGRAGDRLAAVEDLVGDGRRRREAAAALHRVGDRGDLRLREAGELEQHVGGALDVLHLVGEVHAGDLARALAAAVAVVVDRRDDRAAEVDLGRIAPRLRRALRHVLAAVADERRGRDRRGQQAVGLLAGVLLHPRARSRRCRSGRRRAGSARPRSRPGTCALNAGPS